MLKLKTLNEQLTTKEKELVHLLQSYEKVLIAFSGGVDSSFLLAACTAVLGPENTVALTAVSESCTDAETESAKNLARMLKVRHILIETDEMKDSRFTANPQNRCYFCKGHLFSDMRKIATRMGIRHILDGTNADDLSDHRPGRKAAHENKIGSPLLETGFTKKKIRFYSKTTGLPTWSMPASPCLASRVAYGLEITNDILEQIRSAEKYLHGLGFPIVRVRHHGAVARIEVPPDEIQRITSKKLINKISDKLKKLGYSWVSVDLKGYRQGSLNEIKKEE